MTDVTARMRSMYGRQVTRYGQDAVLRTQDGVYDPATGTVNEAGIDTPIKASFSNFNEAVIDGERILDTDCRILLLEPTTVEVKQGDIIFDGPDPLTATAYQVMSFRPYRANGEKGALAIQGRI